MSVLPQLFPTHPLPLTTVPPPSTTGSRRRGKSGEKFCLKWNNFGRNVTTTFKSLLENEEFVDISLSAEGYTIKAHKVVLSASSPYFRDMLSDIDQWQHPVIVLRDVPFSDLQGIVEFIYHGEVNIDQEDLNSFLKTAQTLKVKGLTEDTAVSSQIQPQQQHQPNEGRNLTVTSKHSNEEEQEIRSPPPSHAAHLLPTLPLHPHTLPPPPAAHQLHTPIQHHPRKSAHPKRSSPAHLPPTSVIQQQLSALLPSIPQALSSKVSEKDEDEEEEEELESGGVFAGEIDDREEEEVNGGLPNLPTGLPHTMHPLPPAVSAAQFPTAAMMAAAAAAAANGGINPAVLQHLMNTAGGGIIGTAPPKMEDKMDTDDELDRKMDADSASSKHLVPDSQLKAALTSPGSGGGGGGGPGGNNLSSTAKKTCPYCFQQLSWHALSRHIRDMHKSKPGFVNCKFCGKMFRNKNSLGCHMWRFHKGEGQQQGQKQDPQQQGQQQQGGQQGAPQGAGPAVGGGVPFNTTKEEANA